VIYDFCFVLYWGTNKMLIIICYWFLESVWQCATRTLMEIIAFLNVPDNIHNWLGSFFREHSHIRGKISSVKNNLASIIQGSTIGSACTGCGGIAHSTYMPNWLWKLKTKSNFGNQSIIIYFVHLVHVTCKHSVN